YLGEFGLTELARDLALGDLGALHLVPDLLHDLRVGERGDVAGVGEVGGRGDHPAHDLARPGLRHVADVPAIPRAGYLAVVGHEPLLDLPPDRGRGREAGLGRAVHLAPPAADLVDDRARRRLRALVHGQRRRLEPLRAQPVARHVDHVVDAAEDAEVAVLGLDRAVAGEVRPVVPVLALRVRVVLGVVRLDEPLRLAPDRLEDARPRVADADVPGLVAALPHLDAVLLGDDQVDADHRGAATAGLHRVDGGQRGAEETAGLGLPPGVHDDRLVLADVLVLPAPDLRLDRLADRGHVLEVVVVLGRLVRTDLAQHADRRRGGVEDVHPEPARDPPRTSRVRVVGRALVDHAGRAE